MIRGIGIDACDVKRMEQQLNNEHFLKRILTENEFAYIVQQNKMAAQSLAAMFAGKEAALKAFGIGLGTVSMQDIAILHQLDGKPYYQMTGKAFVLLQKDRMHLSITHEKGLAIAMAVLEGE